jgi:hypothetical protein
MGNRARLILAKGPAGSGGDLAYETNNDIAPFWFAALAEADLVGWEARWQALTVEEPAEDAYAAAILWLPWPRAEARLMAAAARVAAAAPPWAGHFAAWTAALRAEAARQDAAWLAIDLVEIFAFHEEPAEMLREARAGIAVFHGTAPMILERDDDPVHLGGYPMASPKPPSPARSSAAGRPARAWRAGWREWMALPGALLIGFGIWDLTGSALATGAAAAVMVWGFVLMLRQAG